jgi:hypothetical protein
MIVLVKKEIHAFDDLLHVAWKARVYPGDGG